MHVHQAAKLVAALLRVARVTAGLAESNGSLPPRLWFTSPAGWLPRTGIMQLRNPTLGSRVRATFTCTCRWRGSVRRSPVLAFSRQYRYDLPLLYASSLWQSRGEVRIVHWRFSTAPADHQRRRVIADSRRRPLRAAKITNPEVRRHADNLLYRHIHTRSPNLFIDRVKWRHRVCGHDRHFLRSTRQCVELDGKDLSCYSNKVE